MSSPSFLCNFCISARYAYSLQNPCDLCPTLRLLVCCICCNRWERLASHCRTSHCVPANVGAPAIKVRHAGYLYRSGDCCSPLAVQTLGGGRANNRAPSPRMQTSPLIDTMLVTWQWTQMRFRSPIWSVISRFAVEVREPMYWTCLYLCINLPSHFIFTLAGLDCCSGRTFFCQLKYGDSF